MLKFGVALEPLGQRTSPTSAKVGFHDIDRPRQSRRHFSANAVSQPELCSTRQNLQFSRKGVYFVSGNNRATCKRTCHFGYGRSRGCTAL
jgi:hypothetical protein